MEGSELVSTIKTFGDVDARSLAQLERCMDAGDADCGIAYEGYVSPSGVGYDIGCGNKAVRTELTRSDLDARGAIAFVTSEITRRISFGMSVPAQERSDHCVGASFGALGSFCGTTCIHAFVQFWTYG